MKILHISPYAELGGCEFNALTIVEEIKAEHHVLLLNDGKGPFVEKWKNAKAIVEQCQLLDLPFYKWKRELQNQLAGRQYEIIIFWSHMHLPVVLSALEPFSNRILVHIGNPVLFGKKQRILRMLQNTWYKYNSNKVELRPVSRYVLQSSTTTPAYKSLKSKVSFKPIVVEDFIKNKDIDSDNNIIGMMARMDAIKDFTTLIRAFAELVKTDDNCLLQLAGDGDARANLELLVGQLEIQNKVQFLGRVNDKKTFYQGIDIFVYSTSAKEGLAGVVGEALVSGIPTICSDLPMLKEWDPENKVVQWFEAKNHHHLTEVMKHSLANYPEMEQLALEYKCFFRNKFAPKTFAENYLRVE